MDKENSSTAPKPFVFVLMPFDTRFDDIYKFGIKGAAQDAGAYAERVDDQIFTEGILERVFNQINKADVIVADMSGRNPNVFYEVGYAHALGKIVLLLTQQANDIPFDLQHQPHIVYEGSIDTLREALSKRVKWAIDEARNRGQGNYSEPFELTINDVYLEANPRESPVVARIVSGPVQDMSVVVRNAGKKASQAISHIYLFSKEQSALRFFRFEGMGKYPMSTTRAHPSDSVEGFGRLYRTFEVIDPLPPETFETFNFGVQVLKSTDSGEEELKLRLHTYDRSYSYRFRVSFQPNAKN